MNDPSILSFAASSGFTPYQQIWSPTHSFRLVATAGPEGHLPSCVPTRLVMPEAADYVRDVVIGPRLSLAICTAHAQY
jgi:hypothetical protein